MDSLAKLYPDLTAEGEGQQPENQGDKRMIVLSHLKSTNFDMISKMGTLIDLTKKVIKKMRLQT